MQSGSKSCGHAATEGIVYFDPEAPPFPNEQPVVVKIGGSLTRQPDRLNFVLEILEHTRHPITVVAGGGAFADEVREAQRRIGFSDATAHRMAILGMHQTALLFASQAPSLVPMVKVTDVGSLIRFRGKPIWLPLDECENDAAIPLNWEATSDAIAVRLAERLGMLPVVFVKSRAPKTEKRDPRSLAEEGLIDPVAADFLVRTGIAFTIIEAGNLPALEGFFSRP